MTTGIRPIAPSELPAVVNRYLDARRGRDIGAAVGSYTPDATVVDEGKTYTGPAEIGTWLSRSATEYTYTTTMVAATQLDDHRYDVLHHLEGNFPGGQVDLHFRFTLRDGQIERLVIEP
jgi:hypothetical protein